MFFHRKLIYHLKFTEQWLKHFPADKQQITCPLLKGMICYSKSICNVQPHWLAEFWQLQLSLPMAVQGFPVKNSYEVTIYRLTPEEIKIFSADKY